MVKFREELCPSYYVIGLEPNNYLYVKSRFTDDYSDIEVVSVEYNCEMHTAFLYDTLNSTSNGATLFSSYDEAKRIIEKIKQNKNKIYFYNSNVLDELIDRDNKFDFKKQLNELKIYRLNPVLVEEPK